MSLEEKYSERNRRYRVHLAVHIFGSVEVSAISPDHAAMLAVAEAGRAQRTFATDPVPFRVEKEVRSQPGGPLIWVEIEKK